MNILTDCPQHLTPLCRHTRPIPARDLCGGEKAAWQALSSNRSLSVGEAAGPLDTLVVIDSAPGSQFDALRNALNTGARLPESLAALALEGRGFKGQRDRSWTAHRGNLHLCVYYHLHTDASKLGMGLTVLPAIAAAAAIRQVSNDRLAPGIKWVNDVLIEDRKVSGVLTATQASGTTIEHVVFGIGMNVAITPPLPPTPFVPAAGCLGHDMHWHQVLSPLLEEIDRRYRELITQGPAGLVAAYRADSIILHRAVKVWPEGTTHLTTTPPLAQGVVTAIDDDLSLHIDGFPETIRSGRLALIP